MQAAVSPVGDHTFLVTATRGSLSGATDGFRVPPFSDRARSELGIAVEVGVGLGRTAQEAEAHARAALARSHAAPGARGFALDREGYALVPAPRAPATAPAGGQRAWTPCPGSPRSFPTTTARTWSTRRPPGGCSASPPDRPPAPPHPGRGGPGLAAAAGRTPQPGRPRQFYRIITEKSAHRPSQ